MITLAMDTSHIFLVLALYQDDQLLGQISKPCWKRQSEEIFPCLEELFQTTGISQTGVDQVVITKGPGSYTGIRIAMTVAKVFCSLKEIPLYTLGTLELYAGKEENVRVLLDARGKRAYTATFKKGVQTSPVEAKPLEEIEIVEGQTVIGDGHLLGLEDRYPDFAKRFLELKDHWQKQETVDTVTPEYLKDIEAYQTHGNS